MLRKLNTLLLLLLLLPTVYAITFYTNEQSTLWASCKNLSYAVSTAKLTIRYPNSTVWKANVTMSIISQGQFNYSFIAPNVTGNYFIMVDCDIGGIHGYDEDDFWIKQSTKEEMGMWELATIMSILIIIGVFAYFAKGEKEGVIAKVLQIFFLIIIFFSLPLLVQLTKRIAISNNAASGITNLLTTIQKITMWVAVILTFVVFIYIVYGVLTLYKEKKAKEEGDDFV